MTALATLVPALKRELAVPGTFDDAFPDTSTKDLIGTLADAFAECQLDSFFKDVVLDATDDDPTVWATTPDLSAAGGALVVIYAGMRTMRSLIRSSSTSSTYKAGSVEASTSQSASVLKAELDYLALRKKELIDAGKQGARTCSAAVVDGYLARIACGPPVYTGGFFPYEYLG